MQIPFRGSGKVYYSDKEYACALYYSKDGGSVVVKVIKHTKSGIGNYLELPLEIEVLKPWYRVPLRCDYRCYIIIKPGREGKVVDSLDIM